MAQTPRPVVVFVINSLVGGGAERVMARLLSQSRGRLDRYDMHLVLLDTETEAYAAPDWLTVHRLNSDKGLFRSTWRLMATLRSLRATLVVSFLTRSNFANLICAKVLRHRSVISERANTSGHHGHGLAGRMSRLLIGILYPTADLVIAVSRGIADDLTTNFGVDAERLVVIPNPVDSQRIKQLGDSPVQRKRPYIVGMGRFVRSKNFALLIEAFSALGRTDIDLVLIGQGPLQQELQALVRDRGVTGQVEFAGFLDNPFPLVAGALAYVLPSNGEGFPNGLVEAMVLGTPVIATDCRSGPAEILDDRDEMTIRALHAGAHGFLVPADDRQAMTQAISRALSPGARQEWSKKARAGAARYGLDSAVESYWAALERTISLGTRP